MSRSSRSVTSDGALRQGGHALITGAAGAIGAAVATSLRARDPGLRLSLVDVDELGARRVAAFVGGDAEVLGWDLAQPAALGERVADLVARRGHVDVLVNCAGIMEVRSLASMPWAMVERLLRVDLESPLRLMAETVPGMVARGQGTVVNVSSLAGVTPLRGCSIYGAAKAGLAMASEIAHLELAPRGVHVVTVYPGPVKSELERRARAQYEASLWSRLAPAGDPGKLGVRIVEACASRKARVVFPALYDLASVFPGAASRFTRAFSPAPAV